MEARIPLPQIRTLFAVASAVALGVSTGRNVLKKGVEQRKQDAIADATKEARRIIKREANAYIAGSLLDFAKRLAIKAIIVGLVGILILALPGPPRMEAIALLTVFAAFLVWDAFQIQPTLRVIWRALSASGFNPKTAVSAAVSTHVFAEAMRQVEDIKLSRTESVLLVAVGTNATAVKTEIAEAVSRLTGESSWTDLRPFLLLAAGKITVLLSAYGLYTWLVVRAALLGFK